MIEQGSDGGHRPPWSPVAILRSPWFAVGLVLRLALFASFGSPYLKDLFIPFLDYAVQNPGENPWRAMPAESFPYGGVLFSLLYIPRQLAFFVFGSSALGSGLLGISLVKLPLLAIDVCLLLILARFCGLRAKKVTLFYWLSPLPIWISYAHGQLDVVVTTFVMLSLLLLAMDRPAWSGAALAAAVSSKFHAVVLLPFMLVYLWNRHFARDAVRRIGRFMAIFLPVAILGFLPLIMASRGLYASMASPQAFRLFDAQLVLGQHEVLLLGLMGVLGVIARLCLSVRISERGLVYGCGIIFGALLVVTAPGPGWYLWVFPFIVLLYVHQSILPTTAFVGLQSLYLVHFALFREWALADSQIWFSLSFTALQTALLGLLITMWVVIVRHEVMLRGRASPVLVGIAGDSGAGKNHFSRTLAVLFNVRNTVLVEGDDYHKWERTDTRWQDYTHLHPKANHLEKLSDHAFELHRGASVFQPHYDHKTGTFTEPRETKPTKTVIVQGLHALYPRALRHRFDLKIFLSPDDNVRLFWKLRRDVGERGHTKEKVLNALERRELDSKMHITPQRAHADWIVEYVSVGQTDRAAIIEGAAPSIAVRHVVWNDSPVQVLGAALSTIPDCLVSIETEPGDLDRVALVFTGKPPASEIQRVGQELFPNLRYITRGRSEPEWQSGWDGVAQIVCLALLQMKTEPI